jgi:hypothetical protein
MRNKNEYLMKVCRVNSADERDRAIKAFCKLTGLRPANTSDRGHEFSSKGDVASNSRWSDASDNYIGIWPSAGQTEKISLAELERDAGINVKRAFADLDHVIARTKDAKKIAKVVALTCKNGHMVSNRITNVAEYLSERDDECGVCFYNNMVEGWAGLKPRRFVTIDSLIAFLDGKVDAMEDDGAVLKIGSYNALIQSDGIRIGCQRISKENAKKIFLALQRVYENELGHVSDGIRNVRIVSKPIIQTNELTLTEAQTRQVYDALKISLTPKTK